MTETSAGTTPRPLEGVNVLELCHYIAGPYCSQILGDQGASVIKVEPPSGERTRRSLPTTDDGESLYFASYNRNKRSVALDLTAADSRPALDELLKWADVIVTNFSAGVPSRLGFGWEHVHAINPRAIMVLITGFGTHSALSNYVALDGIVTAMSGIASMTGSADGPPYIGNVLLADHVTAVQAALAATTALHLRTKTGEGTFVEVSMLRSLAALLGDHVPSAATLGRNPSRTGNRSTMRFGNTYRTSDGYVIISPLTPVMWRDFCVEIGHPEWGAEDVVTERRHVHDDRFRREIEAATEAWTSVRTGQEALERLQSLGIPTGRVKSVRELYEEDDALDLRLFEKVTLSRGGEATVLGRVFDWDGQERYAGRNVIPVIGEHSAEVLGELGLPAEQVARMQSSGIVASNPSAVATEPG